MDSPPPPKNSRCREVTVSGGSTVDFIGLLAQGHFINAQSRFFFPAIPNGANRTDPNSFLFSLVNPSGLQPTKMSLIPGKKSSAIHCHSSSGPRFGSGIDLHIPNAPNSNNCSVKLNSTYQLPPGQNANTFLTGNQNFTLAEMEVFKFEK